MVEQKTISSSDNKRFAKNTVLLYIRTLIVMGITLFTSRVILASLGIDDYGTYNVIAGFVSMFSMIGGTLVTATQRFVNVELGKKENGNVNLVFNTALGIHAGLVLVLIFLFETFGLWFLNYKMNIPDGRMFAANVVFQCSIVAFISNILCMPFNAIIIAFERMKAFAYISLLDAILKLGICYILFVFGSDRLILYAILLMGVSLMNNVIYFSYCRKQFPDTTRMCIVREKDPYIRQTSFAGYTFLGSIAAILANQGVNLILNIFCGVAVNAARGIAIQVQQAVIKFVNDFMTALKPQITKTYAAGELDKSVTLVYRGAKFSFFLMLIFATPIIFTTQEILTLWLKNYPADAVIFIQLTLVYAMTTVLSTPLTTIILATGQIKSNAFIIGGLRLFVLPLSYVVLKLGYPAYAVYWVLISIDALSVFTRLHIMKSITGVGIYGYIKEVLWYVFVVSVFVAPTNYCIVNAFDNLPHHLILYVFVSCILTIFVIAIFGITTVEKKMLRLFIHTKIRK